eukprot:TRINITY_DN30344_c0_g3_i3.p1 TRINITY_DN30344_c0_g3~~TRINITY_DN30344_c0_g3_i3.p1  ORF type:complete len:173 (-),score=23.27 TRINITY_DN30344_c0_g3_i3:10-528(-)
MPFPDRRRSPGRRGDSREPDRFERRRLRSVSPDRYRRSSPPHKRYRREDDFYDRHRSPSPFGRSGRRDSGGYGERGGRGYEEHPPYHEEYEEQGGKGEGHHHQPMSFKEFLYDLPMDDISPEVPTCFIIMLHFFTKILWTQLLICTKQFFDLISAASLFLAEYCFYGEVIWQ